MSSITEQLARLREQMGARGGANAPPDQYPRGPRPPMPAGFSLSAAVRDRLAQEAKEGTSGAPPPRGLPPPPRGLPPPPRGPPAGHSFFK